ncbi:MAG: hypothetical protein KAW01_03985 [Deltaproteobacteria bacterium]|nr:hypothetical protein [Deltaproteobacteria bacterium]
MAKLLFYIAIGSSLPGADGVGKREKVWLKVSVKPDKIISEDRIRLHWLFLFVK